MEPSQRDEHGVAVDDDLLADLVAASASLDERRADERFKAIETPPDVTDDRIDRWVDAVASGDLDRFRRTLDDRGWREEDIRTAVSDVGTAQADELDWAREIATWLRAFDDIADLADHADVLVREPIGWYAEIELEQLRGFGSQPPQVDPTLLVPFFAHAVERVTARSAQLSDHRLILAPCIAPQLARALVNRLARASVWLLRSQDFRRSIGDCADLRTGGEAHARWMAVFSRYPGLIRVFGRLLINWTAATAELLDRLVADADAIARLTSTPLPLTLSSVQPGAGDAHGGGRSVTALVVHDARLVYKPRDLRAMEVWNETVRWLNETSAPPQGMALPTNDAVLRADYGWESWIDTRMPTDSEEWATLAYQFGMLIALTSAIGSSDLTQANIVISNDGPHVADTETMLTVAHQHQPNGKAWRRMLSTALVSAPLMMEKQNLHVNAGALGDPTLLPIFEHLDRLREGYKAAYSALAENAVHLTSDGGPLAGFEGVPIRQLYRNTHVYERLIAQSVLPSALRSGINRDIVLEKVWKAYRDEQRLLDVHHGELESLRDMDVPIFTVQGSSILDGTGRVVQHIERTLLAEVRSSVGRLTESPPLADLDALLYCAQPSYRPSAPVTETTALQEALDVRAIALEIAEHLSTGASDVLAIAPGKVPIMRPLPLDLANGAAGLVVVLASAAEVDPGNAILAATLESLSGDVIAALGDPPPASPHGPARPGDAYFALSALSNGSIGDTSERARAALARTDLEPLMAAFPSWDSHQASAFASGLSAHPETRHLALKVVSELGERVDVAPRERPGVVDAGPVSWTYASDEALRSALLVRLDQLDDTTGPPGAAVDTNGSRPHRPADLVARVEVALTSGVATAADVEPWLVQAADASVLDLLVLAECCLDIGAHTGEDAWQVRAAELAAQIASRRRTHGKWFPESIAPDRYRLSALWGLGAVLALAVRLETKRPMPTLRSLSIAALRTGAGQRRGESSRHLR